MNQIHQIFDSPELLPIDIDFQRRVVRFVRMSPETYRKSVFLDHRTHHAGDGPYEIRMDDLLYWRGSMPSPKPAVHYVLHTTFCCSTLLARYFELLESCHVLKEPGLLTQLAILQDRRSAVWKDAVDISLALLGRKFPSNEYVLIKPHEPVNSLADLLLAQDSNSTVTFLSIALRPFLLAVLKDQWRRNWVRRRVAIGARNGLPCRDLADVNVANLTDAQSAAYLWSLNQSLRRQLVLSTQSPRVLLLDGDLVAESPKEALRNVASIFGCYINEEKLDWMISHPLMSKYSKDTLRPYNAMSRRAELVQLERHWGAEANEGISWVESHTS